MTGMRHVPVDRAAPAAAYLRARQLLARGRGRGHLPRGRDLLLLHGAGADARRRGARARDRGTGACRPASGASSGSGASGREVAGRKPRPSLRRGRPNDLVLGPADARPARRRRRGPGPPGSARCSPGMLEGLQARPHLRPAPGEHAPWYPAHLGGHAPDRRSALALDVVPRTAVAPTWGPAAARWTAGGARLSGRALGWCAMASTPKRQRVAAYAVIVRDDQILLSRLSPLVTREQLWTLPGGGLDHGEDPRDAVIREVHEETGLHADVSDTARVYSAHMPQAWRGGRRVDAHAVRIVYEGWVAPGSPEPRVRRGRRLDDRGGLAAAGRRRLRRRSRSPRWWSRRWPTTGRSSGSGWRRTPWSGGPAGPTGGEVLLTRLSATAAHPGRWTLPGGGDRPRRAPGRGAGARGAPRSAGVTCEVGELLDVARLALLRHRPERALGGLPRRPPGLRRHRRPRRRAAGRRDRRHHRRGRLGAGRRRGSPAPSPCSTWSPTPSNPERLPMTETVFTYGAPGLKFGSGASAEIGHDLAASGARRVLLVTDPGVAATGHPARIAEQVGGRGPRGDDVRRRAGRADRRLDARRDRASRATPGRSTRSSPSAAARRSTPPRRSTCC